MPASRPTAMEARFFGLRGMLKAARLISVTGILSRLPTSENVVAEVVDRNL